MSLSDYLAPYGLSDGRETLCWRCERACGKCPWSAVDPVTNEIQYKPVPGWKATKVSYPFQKMINRVKVYDRSRDFTYHVISCPLFIETPPRNPPCFELTPEQEQEFLKGLWKEP